MRKLVLAVALIVCPVLASAAQSSTLLTPDGTLYSVGVRAAASANSSSIGDSHLVLTTRQGSETKSEVIPASLVGGSHSDASMAYDAESSTLFLFWLHRQSISGSELLFASRSSEGAWSEATPFGSRLLGSSENLRIAITRKVLDEGTGLVINGLTVHATWWDWDTHYGEWFAEYQMLTIVNGAVAEAPVSLNLRTLARTNSPKAKTPEDLDTLRHPLLFTSPKQDSVMIVFGDVETGKLHEVRVTPLKPVSNGRLRVPVGRHEAGSTAPNLTVSAEASLEGVYGDADRMALYTTDKDTVRFVVMRDGAWSNAQSIALDSQLSAGAAVDALRRLISDH
jgi:hypothetical protein